MLSLFVLKRTFCLLRVTLYVDCELKEASFTITYDRRIVDTYAVPFHEVRDVTLADRWLSRDVGEHGTLEETWEWRCRTGIAQAVKAAQAKP